MMPLNPAGRRAQYNSTDTCIKSDHQNLGVSLNANKMFYFCLLLCVACLLAAACCLFEDEGAVQVHLESWYEMWCGSEFEYWGSFEYLQRRFSLARFSPWIPDVNSTPKLRLTHGTVAIWESQSVQKKWKLFKTFACFLKHLLSPRADIEGVSNSVRSIWASHVIDCGTTNTKPLVEHY